MFFSLGQSAWKNTPEGILFRKESRDLTRKCFRVSIWKLAFEIGMFCEKKTSSKRWEYSCREDSEDAENRRTMGLWRRDVSETSSLKKDHRRGKERRMAANKSEDDDTWRMCFMGLDGKHLHGKGLVFMRKEKRGFAPTMHASSQA